jgi:hypothetical protein
VMCSFGITMLASRNRRLLCAVNLELLNTTRELHILTTEVVASKKISPYDYVLCMRDTFNNRNTSHLLVPAIEAAYNDFFSILDLIEPILQAGGFGSVNTHPALHPPTIHQFIAKTQQQLGLIRELNPTVLGTLIANAVRSLTNLDRALANNGFP